MRQFVSDRELGKDGCLTVTGQKFRYLSSVLRVTPGDMIYVRLPSGVLQPMTVAVVDGAKKQVLLSRAATSGNLLDSGGVKAAPMETKGKFNFHLFQFVPKPPKFDLVIRQAAECGLVSVVPVAGEFCQKGNIESAVKKSSPTDERWKKIITEAREQSGSPVETRVSPCMNLTAALEFWQDKTATDTSFAVVLYERTEKTRGLYEAFYEKKAAALKSGTALADIAIMVGAEGGISPAELEMAVNAGFIPVHFETNILRCETAALYGIAALQSMVLENEAWKLKE